MIQKIAYSYQKTNDYSSALHYYKRAELFEANRSWNLKKMGYCYRKQKNHKEALHCFLQAEKLEPKNLYIQANLGHCHLDLKKYEKALEYYFKVEFLDNENSKIWRPIAWCSFMLEKIEQARKYYHKIIDNNPNKYDFLNLGHAEWCASNKKAAVEAYKKSIQKNGNNFEEFFVNFEMDKNILLKHDIKDDEIILILDYLRFVIDDKFLI